jgi:hypothetical protein
VEIGDRTVEPQGRAMADWSLAALGPRRRFIADESNGRFLLAHGGQLPLAAQNGLAKTVLEPVALTPETIRIMRDRHVDYVVVDRRAIAADNLAGYFFAPRGTPAEGARGEAAPELLRRFEVDGSQRLFDSGDIVVYDVRGVRP